MRPSSFAGGAERDPDELLKRLGVTGYMDPQLVRLALTHASAPQEVPHEEGVTNERLEFLGDSVLKLCIAYEFFRQRPLLSEGEMTQFAKYVVSDAVLGRVAADLQLGDYLVVPPKSTVTPSMLATALEALFGAMFVAYGFAPTATLIWSVMGPVIAEAMAGKAEEIEYKSALQEFTQGQLRLAPRYELVKAEGPPHQRTFTCQVWLGDQLYGEGKGSSKKKAEQLAAQAALEKLKTLP